MNKPHRITRRLLLSLTITLLTIVFAYVPLPGLNQTVTVVSGTELQEILPTLKAKFEQENPAIQLDLRFQGSQDIVNNYIDDKNDFTPTVLIPGNQDLLTELQERWQAQNSDPLFYEAPRSIAKSVLVGIAWADRGKILFSNGQFDWSRLEKALQKGSWSAIGGSKDWGSVDLIMTDPERSNSGQLTLALWAQSKSETKSGKASLDPNSFTDPKLGTLFSLVKRSIYQPPRSTDVLLQEFITRGPNQADVATVYESVALHRWQQSQKTRGQPYQIYYIDPTIETVSAAAIVRRGVSSGTAEAARRFLDFLTQPEQQSVFVQYGFRPVDHSIDLRSVTNSPWSQNIPGAAINPPGVASTPDRATLAEIVRLWQRAS